VLLYMLLRVYMYIEQLKTEQPVSTTNMREIDGAED